MLRKQEFLDSIKNTDGGREVGSYKKCLEASMVPLSLVNMRRRREQGEL